MSKSKKKTVQMIFFDSFGVLANFLPYFLVKASLCIANFAVCKALLS
jgi:hypothetical protein